MSKGTVRASRIKALAYFHRYGWTAVMLTGVSIWFEQTLFILSVCLIAFAVWSFVGYKNKWKHIYCSYQNAHRQEMTPNNVQWHNVRKSDAYGESLIFLIIGCALSVIGILY